VAVRIAQRMGLHQDEEKLGLPPFDVQMRRRLFYKLTLLECVASKELDIGMSIVPDTFDAQRPLNINDDQIWPGMTETPEEQQGATEMTFCLVCSYVEKFFSRVGKAMESVRFRQFKDYNEVEPVISEAESEVEEKYIRYCDIISPLHFLTTVIARTAITAVRLQIRLPKIRNQTATDVERRELFQLSQKIIDTDTAVYAYTSLKKYLWYRRTFFFLWGSWHSLILILTTLRKSDVLSPAETDAAWRRLEQVYDNHGELLESKKALHIAVGRLALKAWDANPPSSSVPEPAFITTLRSLRKVNLNSRAGEQDSNIRNIDNLKRDTMSPTDPSTAGDGDT
ncbi:MAG: hypothetical protein Q9214_007889, partial [Letrouitia sp. 1 TL-2023]